MDTYKTGKDYMKERSAYEAMLAKYGIWWMEPALFTERAWRFRASEHNGRPDNRDYGVLVEELKRAVEQGYEPRLGESGLEYWKGSNKVHFSEVWANAMFRQGGFLSDRNLSQSSTPETGKT